MSQPDHSSPERQVKEPPQRSSFHWLIMIVLGLLVVLVLTSPWTTTPTITFTELAEQIAAGNIEQVKVSGRQLTGSFRQPVEVSPEGLGKEESSDATAITTFQTVLPSPLDMDSPWLKELAESGVSIEFEEPTNYGDFLLLMTMMGLFLLFVVAWFMVRRTRDQMMGGGMLGGVIKSPARRYEASGERITFDDVAGLEGVKKDLEEIVFYLKDAEKFQKIGAQVPKGVLLMGPPGTGKTLLARAVAGEAGVPFFSINGSEFIQLFVGVGAGRVRDLFKTAQENSPAILFVDEIDAVGRQRGAGMGGGHDEREQTLNQILSEMDGFSPTTTVIVLAATNRPDVLDPALLRPGRFDRHITVDRPSVKGRQELFELHSKKVPIAEDVNFEKLAKASVGLTGADIRNLVNEAALWATRSGKEIVNMSDFEYARDKVLMGSAREDILSPREKEITAFHESGHALIAWYHPGCDPVHKVTIIPRGRALGVTQLFPDEDRYNMGQNEMVAQLIMALGGRTAEKIRFDEYSAGAENDLKRATELARRMVTRWGMSDRIGPIALSNGEEHPFLGREMAHEHRTFSERTAQIVDEEVANLLNSAAERAKQILIDQRDKLEQLAQALLEREVLDHAEISELLGPAVARNAAPINNSPKVTGEASKTSI